MENLNTYQKSNLCKPNGFTLSIDFNVRPKHKR